MDREIPRSERMARKRMMWLRYGGIVAGIVVAGFLVSRFFRSNVNAKSISVSEVDKGTIEVSVTASGKVLPAFEEAVISPITARVMEVYCHGGDSVDVGTPLLKLDLQSTQTDYQNKLDELQMKRYQLEQLKVNNQTRLSDLEMQLKVSEMKLGRQEADLQNERYLDSLGSGTTERVRQAELACSTARLELQQLRQQLEGERRVRNADQKVKELEINIFEKNLGETERTLEDARICSPRHATLTYIYNEIGGQIGAGTKIAVVSDLNHFKIDCEISDAYGDRVCVGGKVMVKVGKDMIEGTVSTVTPLSRNGLITFTVQLAQDDHPRLRSGLRADVYVITSIKDDVLRIRNASFYTGAGEYRMYVFDGDNELALRSVRLGESNFDMIEVMSGLEAGDRVVVSDMGRFGGIEKIHVRK
ncbi:MAG: HlyD family efflux transporter periplasmic adaptor subunit [Bacteroides sp.]|nr:HlyD family efflux transporter periplasmic adaptor subunit [Bacteroides sp.]MCM1421782.1 HlyD family efflux transporter periplasmic adaptor subunit [Bacteroides sp.]